MGVNLPWLHYGHDFGQAWGPRGVSTPASRSRLERDLSVVAGSEVVRWFVLADGRALDHSTPEQVLTDFEAALALAEAHDVRVMPVLFDYLWFDPPTTVDGVQLFGRTDLAVDPLARQALIETWIVPLAEAYRDDPRLFAIDLINEPEWALDHVAFADLSAFLEDVAAPWKEGGVPLTVGSASADDAAEYWLGWGLDFLQVHHYGRRPLPPRAEAFGGAEVWVGEFTWLRSRSARCALRQQAGSACDFTWLRSRSARCALRQQAGSACDFASRGTDVAGALGEYAALGYDGALPWSLRGDDAATDRAAIEAFFQSAAAP